MGYIIGLIIILLLIPLVIVLTRRTGGPGGVEQHDRGMTPGKPSSDEPTPRAGPGMDPKIPPA